MDLRRYLDDEPVQACPPSAGYRLRKFARRNRAALAMAWVVAIALIAVGVAAALAHRNRLTEQRRLIERRGHAERLLAERRQNTLEKALMDAMCGDFDAAGKRIDEAELLGARPASCACYGARWPSIAATWREQFSIWSRRPGLFQ